MEPVPFLTAGDWKSELSRWADDIPVTFYQCLWDLMLGGGL
jgi:hypothetical protein